VNSRRPLRRDMHVLGTGVCFQDPDVARHQGFDNAEIDASILAPMLRRRTSIATKMAITALVRACKDAQVDSDLPVIFTSSIGEMAVTDALCRAIAESRLPLSPTRFHNSVHNTAAGYWSLSVGSMAPMQSMAGMEDSFAMGLLEAYCQLQSGVERLLLVSYDESMPAELLPEFRWHACSSAWVLSISEGGDARVSQPYMGTDEGFNKNVCAGYSASNPTQASIDLLKSLNGTQGEVRTLRLSGGLTPWLLDVEACL